MSWVFLIRTLLKRARDDDPTEPPEIGDEDAPGPSGFHRRKSPNGALPHGKGMFVRHLRRHCGSPDEMADQCRSAGLKWVAILAAWHDGSVRWYNKDIHRYAERLSQDGVRVWVWGYPRAAIHPSFMDAMTDRAQSAGADGIIIDPEKPWIGRSELIARELVDELKDQSGLPVGFTSYGWPRNFRSFPWKGFTGANFAIPQAYDSRRSMGPEYQENSVKAYEKLGFSPIVPALRTYNIRPEEIGEIFHRTPMPIRAMVWWDWYNTGPREWEAIGRLPSLEEPVA